LIATLKTWIVAHWTSILAQIGHFLAGYAFILTGYRFGSAPLGGALLEVWAIPKEFWFDYKYEDAATRGSSVLDFAMYQVGAAVGAAVIYGFR
jgi:hypothetical protein